MQCKSNRGLLPNWVACHLSLVRELGMVSNGMSEWETDERRIEKCNYIFQTFEFFFCSLVVSICLQHQHSPYSSESDWRRFFLHIHISFLLRIWRSTTRAKRSSTNAHTLKMRTMWNAAVNRNIHIKNVHFFPISELALSFKLENSSAKDKKRTNTHTHTLAFVSHFVRSGGRDFFLFHITFEFDSRCLFCRRVHLQCILIFINVSLRLVFW